MDFNEIVHFDEIDLTYQSDRSKGGQQHLLSTISFSWAGSCRMDCKEIVHFDEIDLTHQSDRSKGGQHHLLSTFAFSWAGTW